MTLSELNSKLTQALKNYIQASQYIDSGKLYNSIKFKCIDNDSGLKIKLNAMDYIYFLDNGDFLGNFFALNTTISIITEYLSTTITLG